MGTGINENLIALDRAAVVPSLVAEYETEIKDDLAAGEYRSAGKVRNHSSIKQPKHAVFINSREGRIVAVNQHFLDIVGYTPGELEDAGVDMIFMNSMDAKNIQVEMDHKGYVIDYRAILRRKDGSEAVGLITSTIRWYNDECIPGNQPLYKSWVKIIK